MKTKLVQFSIQGNCSSCSLKLPKLGRFESHSLDWWFLSFSCHCTWCSLTSAKCWAGDPPSLPHFHETMLRHRKLIIACHCSQPPLTSAQTLYCLSWTIYRQPGLEKHELGHPLQSPTLQRLFPYFILAIVLPYLVSPTHNRYSLTVYSSHAQGYIYIFFLMSSLILLPFLILG